MPSSVWNFFVTSLCFCVDRCSSLVGGQEVLLFTTKRTAHYELNVLKMKIMKTEHLSVIMVTLLLTF